MDAEVGGARVRCSLASARAALTASLRWLLASYGGAGELLRWLRLLGRGIGTESNQTGHVQIWGTPICLRAGAVATLPTVVATWRCA